MGRRAWGRAPPTVDEETGGKTLVRNSVITGKRKRERIATCTKKREQEGAEPNWGDKWKECRQAC